MVSNFLFFSCNNSSLGTSYSDFSMNYTRKLFILFSQKIKCFSRCSLFQRSNAAFQESPLAKLPTELLHQIVNDLPIVSAVSLSLSCRHIHFLIGTQYIQNLATLSHETLAFLNLIERDLPNQIVCNSCKKLHRMQDARKYTESGQRILQPEEPDCLRDDRKAIMTLFIHENFSTTVFKMAMKHYRLFGNDTHSRQLLNLLSGKFCADNWGEFVRKYKADCRIRNGSLFTHKHISFHGTCTGPTGIKRNSIRFLICPHLVLESTGRSTSLRITTSRSPFLEKWSIFIHPENSTIKKTSWDVCSELQHCRYCRTAYKAGFKHNSSCTIIFTITIWKDLGQGPESEEFKAQLRLQDRWLYPQPNQFHGEEIVSVFQAEGQN